MTTLCRTRFVAVFAAVAAVAGCASLFTDSPRHLYRLAPSAASYPPDLPRVSAQLLIDVPLAPSAVDTARIALSRAPASLDYFADAEWEDRAPRLVQSALIQAFEASKAVAAVDRELIGVRGDFVLKSELRHFEAVYDSPAGSPTPPQIWVGLHARLVKMPERAIVAQKSVERKVPAGAKDIPSVIAAFDAALSGVTHDIVVWAVAERALSVRR